HRGLSRKLARATGCAARGFLGRRRRGAASRRTYVEVERGHVRRGGQGGRVPGAGASRSRLGAGGGARAGRASRGGDPPGGGRTRRGARRAVPALNWRREE